MSFSRLIESYRKRAAKREYRRIVRRWYADGGDDRFRFAYTLGPDSLVLDIGGYEGQWASDLYSRYRCRIVVFEPVAEFARSIAARFAHNDAIEVLQCGLGGTSRSETIHIRGASSSTQRKKNKSAPETIQIIDAEKWFRENDVDTVDLMKINIEGGEYELLERLIATGSIEKVDNIQVQFHNFTHDAPQRMERIQRDLARTHMPTYQYRFVWENWTKKPA